MEKTNKFETNHLLSLIIKMSIPSIFSMLIQSMYNIVDSIFVAKIGTEALTAVSIAFPIQNLILALTVGFGTGLNAFLSRKLGSKDNEEANQAATQGIFTSLLHYLLVVVLGLVFAKPFMALFSDDALTLSLGYEYISVIFLFSFGVFIHITIEKVYQASGNMIAPMIFQLVGSLVNIILDPILIFGWFGLPSMGIRGAAIATVIGQLSSMCLAILFFKKGHMPINFVFKNFKWSKSLTRELYYNSIPSFLLLSIGSIMVSGINLILATTSQVGVLIFGIYYKVQSFVFMPINGIVQGTLPIMSYNYGAKNTSRLQESLKLSVILAEIFSVIGTIIFLLFSKEIISLFSTDQTVLTIGEQALKIIALNFCFASIGYVFTSYFQATGKQFSSVCLILIRQLILLLPMAFILSHFFGIAGIWWAFVLTEAVCVGLSFWLYRRKR
ncbi:MATE family efflux transporter [Enterococcus alishanensis]